MTLVLKFSRFPSLSGGILLFSQSGCYVDGLHRGNKRAVGIEPAAGAALSYLSWNPGYIEYHKITRCSGENPSLGRSCLCFNGHHWEKMTTLLACLALLGVVE